ncbi:ester cyclase [Streptomyces sp. NPDC087226]|uniref:ester cyclase n=1 Tax=Streptomyces sp. NPDC087226 TaxID=3365771 RepID=UPI00380E33E9
MRPGRWPRPVLRRCAGACPRRWRGARRHASRRPNEGPGSGGSVRRRTPDCADGWKKSVEHLRGVFADLTVTIEHLVESGDMAAVRSVGRGVHVGEPLGVPGTGREVELRASDFPQVAGVRTWYPEDYFGIATRIGPTFTRDARPLTADRATARHPRHGTAPPR